MKKQNKENTVDWVKTVEQIDWDKLVKENEIRQEEADRRRQKEEEKEAKRFKKLSCPVCKSTKKYCVVKSDNNGVFGPGYSSWKTEEYLVCESCGVMFKDINKPKNG